MDKARLQFQELHSFLLEVKRGLNPQIQELQEQLNALILSEAQKVKPRIKTQKSAIEILGNKRVVELQAPFLAQVRALCNTQAESIQQTESQLKQLAEQIELVNSAEETIFSVKSTHTYSTQGCGAIRYAEGAARLEGIKPAHYGINHRIEKESRGQCSQYGLESADFKVIVSLDELDTLVLKFKPEATLEEFVSGCWKRGLNPRVYYPQLPHGFEESAEIFYF